MTPLGWLGHKTSTQTNTHTLSTMNFQCFYCCDLELENLVKITKIQSVCCYVPIIYLWKFGMNPTTSSKDIAQTIARECHRIFSFFYCCKNPTTGSPVLCGQESVMVTPTGSTLKTSLGQTVSLSENMTLMHQIYIWMTDRLMDTQTSIVKRQYSTTIM